MRDDNFYPMGVCNDWMYETFYIGPVIHSNAGTVSTNSQDKERKINNGDKLDVKLRDGRIVEATAFITMRNTSYGDMGHTCIESTEVLSLAIDKDVTISNNLKYRFSDPKKREQMTESVKKAISRMKAQKVERECQEEEYLDKQIADTEAKLKELKAKKRWVTERLDLYI